MRKHMETEVTTAPTIVRDLKNENVAAGEGVRDEETERDENAVVPVGMFVE